MPRMTSTSWGTGDNRWLGSSHGTFNARTEILDISSFTKGTHYPDGYIPSGMPVAKVGGKLVPYDATPDTGNAASFAGHLLTDQRVVNADENLNVPLLDHGRVNIKYLPVEGFTAPTEQPDTTIVYLEA